MREDKEALQALSDNGHSPIKREQGQKLANKIRAVKYLECSALTQRGLKQVNLHTKTFFSFNPIPLDILRFRAKPMPQLKGKQQGMPICQIGAHFRGTGLIFSF